MRKGLRFRLASSFLVTAVAVVLLTTALTFLAVNSIFGRYVRATLTLRHHRVVQAIEEAYAASDGDWGTVRDTVGYLGLLGGFDFVVKDTSGNTVFTSSRRGMRREPGMMGLGRMGMGGGLGGGVVQPGQEPGEQAPVPPSTKVANYPLMVDRKRIGTVAIAYPAAYGIFDVLERAFRRSLGWVALLGALLASLTGWIVGLWLSGRLVRPILMLRDATVRFTKGDLSAQVPVESDDEVGELSASFNEMSSRLQRLEGMRRKLTADIAHELRTPIAVARNLVEAMRDKVLPADDHNLGQLEGELGRLGEIVSDLRALSVAESGQMQLEIRPVDLREVVNEVAARWEERFRQKGVGLATSFGERPVVVNGDAEALERVFMNLVANAHKYTDPGGRVALSVVDEVDTGVVTVEDTGAGIEEAELPFVFERFYRGENAKGSGEEGTGVGLAIVRELVQAHRGTVKLDSALGKGTVAVVKLPLAIDVSG